MSTRTSESLAGRLLHRPVDTGFATGADDRYTFLVTGEESAGAYFAMETSVPPGGGPPPHIHSREDETATPITLLMNWSPAARESRPRVAKSEMSDDPLAAQRRFHR